MQGFCTSVLFIFTVENFVIEAKICKTDSHLHNLIMFYIALFSTSDLKRLEKEISTMLSFEHTNVMPLSGVCLDGEMPLLIMPFMSNGSVLEFVKQHKNKYLLRINGTQQEV